MAAELITAPEAEEDLAEAYAWYESRRPGLGEHEAPVQVLARAHIHTRLPRIREARSLL